MQVTIIMRSASSLAEVQQVLQAHKGKLVVLDCMAVWCGPCAKMAPVLERLQTEYPDMVLVKIDVDVAEDVAAKYQITAMPTLVFLKGGREVERVIGADVAKIRGALDRHG